MLSDVGHADWMINFEREKELVCVSVGVGVSGSGWPQVWQGYVILEARFVLTKANLVRTRLVGSELKFLAMPSARGVNQ